ncbi:MAG: DUF4419 domain-containing protein, partial [Bacteroidota bacterium]
SKSKDNEQERCTCSDAYKKFKLDWWIDHLEEPLDAFIAAFEGSVDPQYWMNMFKLHTPEEYGAGEQIDGWITNFYPYDRDGNKRVGLPIRKVESLPNEFVKVDFTHIILGPDGQVARPLQFVAGFVGAEQSQDDFAIRPHIDWFVGHPKPEDLLNKKPQYWDGLTYRNLREFPLELLAFEEIGNLELHFLDQVDIPESIKTLKIRRLALEGEISFWTRRKLKRWLADTYLEINGKEY